jgi:hypothetical protein
MGVSGPGAGQAEPKRWRIPRLTRSITDPPEPWEIPVLKRDRYKIDRTLAGRPFRPTKPQDVPAGAGPALEAVCGTLPLENLYVVPRTTRLTTTTECVVTPAKVLAFGERTVGLWVDDGPNGRVMSVPVDRLLAVDDRAILLYGRLRLIAADTQLVVRYNTVSRDDLTANLLKLRSAMATKELPIESSFLWLDPGNRRLAQSELPHKWRVVLEYPTVRPNLEEPASIAVGDVSEIRRGRTRPASGVAILGSRELVIANEPTEYLDPARYGVDLLAVPRRLLDSLGWDGRQLTVHVGVEGAGAEAASSVTLPLDPHLVEAMKSVFGSAVRWV